MAQTGVLLNCNFKSTTSLINQWWLFVGTVLGKLNKVNRHLNIYLNISVILYEQFGREWCHNHLWNHVIESLKPLGSHISRKMALLKQTDKLYCFMSLDSPILHLIEDIQKIIELKRYSNEINIYLPFDFHLIVIYHIEIIMQCFVVVVVVVLSNQGSCHTSKTKVEIVKYLSCFTYIPCHPLGTAVFIGLYLWGRREQNGFIKVVKL